MDEETIGPEPTVSEERSMKCDTIQKSCKRTSRFLEHSLIIFTGLEGGEALILSG
jgi:hypothetical protein